MPFQRLPFNRTIHPKNDIYNTWQSNQIEFHSLDSTDMFLTIRVLGVDTNAFGGVVNDQRYFFTLAIKPSDKSLRWNCI